MRHNHNFITEPTNFVSKNFFFSVIEVNGKDAGDFLNNLLTVDLHHLLPDTYKKTLILSPKGEILFVLFIKKQFTSNTEEDLNRPNYHLYLSERSSHLLENFLNQRIFLEEVSVRILTDVMYFKNQIFLPVSPSQSSGNPAYNFDNTLLEEGLELFILEQKFSRNSLDKPLPIISALSLPNLADYIDFNKGCYPGQEIITRTHTRGQSAVYWLVGLQAMDKESSQFLNELILTDSNTQTSSSTHIKKIKLFNADKQVGNLFLVGISHSDNLGDSAKLPSTALVELHRDLAQKKTIITLTTPTNTGRFKVIHGSFTGKSTTELPSSQEENNTDKFNMLMKAGLNAYHEQDDFSEAEKHFTEARNLNFEHPDPWEALAIIKEKLGAFEEAISLNKEFAARSKESALPHTNLSRLYMLKGQIELAEAEKQQATILMFKQAAREKKLVNQETNLSRVETSTKPPLETLSPESIIKNNLKQEAKRKKAMFNEVLKLDPEDEIANFGLGKILFEEQLYADAIPHLKKTIKINPKFSLAYSFLGNALFKNQQIEQATDILMRGLNCARETGEMLPLKAMEEILKEINQTNNN